MNSYRGEEGSQSDPFFEKNPCPVLVLEREIIREANPAAERFLVDGSEEIRDQSLLDYFPEGEREEWEKILTDDERAGPVKETVSLKTSRAGTRTYHVTLFSDESRENPRQFFLIRNIAAAEMGRADSSTRELRDELQSTVQSLADTLQVKYAFLAKVYPEREQGRMVVFLEDGTFREPFAFDITRSILNDIEDRATCHSNEVRDAYPADELLSEYGVEGFAGVRCTNESGPAELMLCAMDPLGIWDVSDTETLLNVYAERVGEEVKHLEEERAIKESEESYRVLFKDHPEPMWVYDVQTLEILDVNHAAIEKYGYRREEFLDLSIKDLRPKEEVHDLLEFLEEPPEIRHSEKVLHSKKDGSQIDVEISSRQISFRGYNARLVNARDVTDREVAKKKIERMANYDPLTELPNRSYFSRCLKDELEKAGRSDSEQNIAVLCLDLEGFNAVNDVLGHSVGDRVLHNLAKEFSECVPEDGMIARWGGDEFTIFLPELETTDSVESIIQTLQSVFEEPFEVEGREFHIDGSVGVALYPQDGRGPEELVGKADIAQVRAKDRPNQFHQFYVEGEMEETSEELQLINDLSQAIDAGALQLHYHPLINCQNGELSGCEALIRWNHEERGLLSPGQFLPVAEATGLIVPLGKWVLRHACEQIVAWNEDRDEPLAVSVNVSIKQIQDDEFLESVHAALNRSGAKPEWLMIELTEKTLMTNLERAQRLMSELRDFGIRVAIDDFGTGYSSLEYLMRLPVDLLKIDRSFTEQLMEEPYVMDLFHMVQTMARRLNMDVVVEGVESYQVLKKVMKQEFKYLQGYLFGEPLPPGRFENRIDDPNLIEPLEDI